MKLNWIENPETRHRTRHSIDHNGIFTLAYAESDVFAEDATLHVSIKSFQCKPMTKTQARKSEAATKEKEEPRPSAMMAALTSKSDFEEQKFDVVFDS
jgi:hypothetical protein